MLGSARKAAGRLLENRGLDLIEYRLSTASPAVTRRTLALAGDISTVIDIGASNGQWTAELMESLPSANYLLFEANPSWFGELDAFDAAHGNVTVEHAAASDHEGEVFFRVDPANPLGGGASETADEQHHTALPCLPIDTAVERRGLSGPYLLKLDTQGHEIEVLAGAERVLKDAALVVMEVYGVGRPGRPDFLAICNHMAGLGFKAAGIADVLARPLDGMFWQADMHFVPATHPAFADRRYA